MPAPKNINELREQTLQQFEKVRTDPAHIPQAKAMTGLANSALKMVKMELEHCFMRKEKPDIHFLKY